jgi:hypothetical protein
MDIMHQEDASEGGASTGRMYLPGYDPDDVGESEVYVRQDRPGGPWVASSLPGDMPEQSARDPHALLAKVAKLYGITGTAKVEDERENARTSYSGTRPLPVAAPAKKAPDRLSGTGRYAKTAPTVSTGGTGPGNVPIGGTDADRRAARPRMEGETDRAYDVRTSVDRASALRKLTGHDKAGLRAIARDEGVVSSSSDTKAALVERLMRVMYDRHADSAAITRMVNRDRTPAVGPVTTPRENTPATGGSITPTMTGSQLLAQRRANAAAQQGRSTPTAGAVPVNRNTGATVRPLASNGPYSTVSPAQADALHRRMTAGQPWTAGQRAALTTYTGGRFKRINGGLRSGKTNPTDTATTADMRASMREIPQDITVNRIATGAAFGFPDSRTVPPGKMAGLVGRVFHDPGFTSTTVNSRRGWIQMRISVPAGTRGAYVESITKNKGETEMILDTGTHYRIDRVETNREGDTVMHVTVVGQDD